MKKTFRLIITILIIILLAGIIAYPKIKPLLASKSKAPSGMAQGQRPGGGGSSGGGQRGGGPGSGVQRGGGGGGMMGRNVLNVTGYVLRPTSMSDLIRSTGMLGPDEEVELSFETSGKIVGINFTEGTRVKKGDLLAKMNDKPLQAQLEKLLAQKKLTEEKEFRQKSLLDKDAISQESYDQIATELQTIQADINLIKARISETELRAPFDGIIGLRYLSEGSYATPSTKIARLVKISPIKLVFSIPERYANDVNIGFPLTFTMDGTNEVFKANVYAVEPKVEQTTKSVVIRAFYPNKNEELKAGRFASVTLQLAEIDSAISIPTEALIPEMEGEMVYVYRKGKADGIRVGTGLRTEDQVQVVSGLKFGDTLITTGILQLRQALPVVLDSVILNK